MLTQGISEALSLLSILRHACVFDAAHGANHNHASVDAPSLHPPYVIVKPQPPGNHRSIGCSMVQPHPKCPCAAALHAFDPQIQSKWLLWIAHTGLYICHVLHPRSLRCRAIIISALQAFRRRRSKVKGSEGATGRRFGAFDAKS